MGFDIETSSATASQHRNKRRLAHIFILAFIFLSLVRLTPHNNLFENCASGWKAKVSSHKRPLADWKECGKGFECSDIRAPLDYHNTTAGNVTLAVGRYLATSKDRLGSLFINPGGPGGSGLGFLFQGAPVLSEILDGKYDIVAWDPRGINSSSPRVECFPNKRTQDIYDLGHPQGFQIGNLSTEEGQEHLRIQLQKAYAEADVISGLCDEYSGEILRHVGTATVVRDLELLANTLDGKDVPINYAGFSYGTSLLSTVIGSYFVNMFPHRVGRVLIDGVVEPQSWVADPGFFRAPEPYQDIDKAFNNFLLSCVTAGPDRCALATNTTTVQELDARIRNTVKDLLIRPLPVLSTSRPGVLTASDVQTTIFLGMYRPRGWPDLANQIASLLAGDGSPILSERQPSVNLSDTTSPQRTTYALNAVTCVDGPPLRGKYTPEEAVQKILEPIVNTYETTTTLFAGVITMAECMTWRARETERYTGPWNSTLANPILIIGNTADPVCPLTSAKAVNSYLRDSRLVIQDGPGHCSLSLTSLCTGKIWREYFISGVLPPNGKVCPVTEVLFPQKSLASNSTTRPTTLSKWSAGEEETALSREDLVLLDQLSAFGEAALVPGVLTGV